MIIINVILNPVGGSSTVYTLLGCAMPSQGLASSRTAGFEALFAEGMLALGLPVANSSHIYMDKIGDGIIAHASSPKVGGSALQGLQFMTGETYIDCLSVYMQAIVCHSFAHNTQKCVRFQRTIARNNVESARALHFLMESKEKV